MESSKGGRTLSNILILFSDETDVHKLSINKCQHYKQDVKYSK